MRCIGGLVIPCPYEATLCAFRGKHRITRADIPTHPFSGLKMRLICLFLTLMTRQIWGQSTGGTASYLESCSPNCTFYDEDIVVFPVTDTSPGKHFYLGGIFPLHRPSTDSFSCGRIDESSFQQMMAFQWAISSANYPERRLGNSAPVVNMAGIVFDTCGTDFKATQSIFGLETCKISTVLPLEPPTTANPKSNGVDRRSILGYVNAVDARRGQTESDARSIIPGLQKPVISTGTVSESSPSTYKYVTPSIGKQMDAIVTVLKESINRQHLYAMVVYSDGDFYRDAFEEFKLAAAARNICIVYQRKLSTPLVEHVLEETARDILSNKAARFVVVLLPDFKFRELNRRILDRTDQPSPVSFVLPPFAEASNLELQNSGKVAWGAISIRHDNTVIQLDKFKDFYGSLRPDTFPNVQVISDFWEQKFMCNLLGHNTNRALRYRDFCNLPGQKMSTDDITPRTAYVIKAVDSMLTAIGETQRQMCSGTSSDICQKMDPRESWTILSDHLQKVKVEGESVFRDQTSGPATWTFKVYNLRKPSGQNAQRYMEVATINNGKYSQSDGISIQAYNSKENEIYPESSCPMGENCEICHGASPTPSTARPSTTTEVDYMAAILNSASGSLATHKVSRSAYLTGIYFKQARPEDQYGTRLFVSGTAWSVVLAVLAGLGILIVIIFEVFIICKLYKWRKELKQDEGTHKDTLHVRSLYLGQFLLLSIFFSYLTLFAYLPSPTKATCGITRFGVGMCYTLMFSILLVKLMVLLKSRTSEYFVPGEKNTPNYVKKFEQIAVFAVLVGIEVIISVQWMLQVPPEAVLVKDNNGELAWICNHYTWSLEHGFWEMSYFIRTEFENHLLFLIYIMILILLTVFFSLKALDIVTNARESRFIAIASGISILIWIPWAMIGGFLRDHPDAHEIGDGCIGFGLFFTATLILFAMFLPKIRHLVNIGVEGVYLEDNPETIYGSSGSVYSPGSVLSPGSVYSRAHRSAAGSAVYADGSVLGMHPMDSSIHVVGDTSGLNPILDASGHEIINADASVFMSEPYVCDPHSLYLKHPGRTHGSALYSAYSSPNLYNPPDPYRTRGLRLTRDLTGRSIMNETLPVTDYASLQRPKSEQYLYRSPRSEIGSL